MIKCYYDSDGYPGVDPMDVHPNIKGFLEQDVQSSVLTCDEILEEISAVTSGKLKQLEGNGNAYSLTLNEHGAVIECLWSNANGIAELPLPVFQECIEVWRRHVLNRPRPPNDIAASKLTDKTCATTVRSDMPEGVAYIAQVIASVAISIFLTHLAWDAKSALTLGLAIIVFGICALMAIARWPGRPK